MNNDSRDNTFAADVDFLNRYGAQVALLRSGRSVVAVSPHWQGRVLTSGACGDGGQSFGWLNYPLIASGEVPPHIRAVGGEDRLWLGPEGGQFSVYFAEKSKFEFAAWQVPRLLDTESWVTVAVNEREVNCSAGFSLGDWSGNRRDGELRRRVTLLGCDDIGELLSLDVAGLNYVGYRTENTLCNQGANGWTPENGALSIWMLGMFKVSDSCRIIVPYRRDGAGRIVKDDYFGRIPADRLTIDEKNGVCMMRADGCSRGKIGLSKERATPLLGSYDPERQLLTVVKYSLDTNGCYANSAWEFQDEPFAGDVVNAYNDGPLDDGTQMGPFYELESSSPAAFLPPGGELTHMHAVCHFCGDEKKLNGICREIFGMELRR